VALEEFYKKKIEEASAQELLFQNKGKKLPALRLLIVILSGISFYKLLSINIYIAIATLIGFVFLFILIAVYDIRISKKKLFFNSIKKINEQELECIGGKFQFFPNGEKYMDGNHNYSSDIDIFGKASLFQYLNRTTLDFSSEILANWLKSAASPDEIRQRQEAVKELNPKIDWRQKLYALGLKYDESENNPQKIIDWILEEPIFLGRKFLFLICTILPIFSAAALVLSFFFLPSGIAVLLILTQILVIILTNKDVGKIHDKVSRNVQLLKAYSEIIHHIENEEFESDKLKKLKANLETEKGSASQTIKYLSSILNKLDYRYNILVYFIINTIFFWDFHQIIRLEKWKSKNHENIVKWFQSVGEIEAISSLANFNFNNPEFSFPEISESNFAFEAKELGHPLIKISQRICNDIEINQTSKILLVTGSNMSGKSTFLRTVGVNIVLATAGSCVCAKKFRVSPMKVLTSMRIIDSLEENTSSFYAELKRLEKILKIVESKEKVFLLLDEILRGTNTNDRHIGSIALIKQLIKNNAVGIIATHDTSLSNLSTEMPMNLENFNFDVQVENEVLFFDYKLHEGVCKSLNASILMKKMGINI
jgi:DNA mismatch repair ATPase MutS